MKLVNLFRQLGAINPRAVSLAAWLVPIAAALIWVWEMRSVVPQIDDAYISYRYSQNLLEGNGLVFNPGEYVEGYTNLLWTLLVAAGMTLGLSGPEAGHWLGLGSGVALLLLTHAFARRHLPGGYAWLAGLAPFVVLSSAVFAIWSSSGLETSLYAAAIMAALLAQAGGRMGWATAAVVIATLTRTDGILAAAAIFGLHLYRNRTKTQFCRALVPVAAYGGCLTALTLFRLVYYGSPLPNTFYAKVGDVPWMYGCYYVIDFMVSGAVLLLPPSILAAWREERYRAGALYILLVGVYVYYVGGDILGYYRFWLPALACLAAMAVHGTYLAWSSRPVFGVVMGAAVVLTIVWHLWTSAAIWVLLGTFGVIATVTLLPRLRLESAQWWSVAALGVGIGVLTPGHFPTRDLAPDPIAIPSRSESVNRVRTWCALSEKMIKGVCRVLLEEKESIKLVAGIGTGKLSYFTRLPVLDMVGLTDPVIAHSEIEKPSTHTIIGHQRSNVAYLLSRRPDYILVPVKPDAQARSRLVQVLPTTRELFQHPDFEAQYVYDKRVLGYRRKDRPAQDI